MLITSFSAILLILMALIIYKHARRGYKKGLSRSLISLCSVLFSVFFGAIVSIVLVSLISDWAVELLQSIPLYDTLSELMMGFDGVLILVFKMVSTLIIYIPVFSILRLIVGVTVAIILRCRCGKKKAATDYYKEGEELYVRRNKATGAAIGALIGFIISVVMLMPAVGCLKAADAVLVFAENLAESEEEESARLDGGVEGLDAYVEYGGSFVQGSDIQIYPGGQYETTIPGYEGGYVVITPDLQPGELLPEEEPEEEPEDVGALIHRYSSDITVNIIDACGGRMIFNYATTVGGYGGFTGFNKELKALSEIDVNEIYSIFTDIGEGEKNEKKVNALLSKLDESAVFEILLVESINGAAEAWVQREDFMGSARPDFGGYNAVDSFVDEMLYICLSTDKKTVAADVRTLVNVSAILAAKRSMFEDGEYETIISELADGTLVKELKTELQKNKHMLSVVNALDGLVMSVVAEEIHNVRFSVELREELFEKFADILTSTSDLSGSVRVSAVTSSVKESLDDYGLEVPEEFYQEIAEQLIENIDDLDGEVLFEQVEEYFNQFVEEGGDISDYLPVS